MGPAGPQQPTPEQLAHAQRIVHTKSIARLLALTGDRENFFTMLQTYSANDRDNVFFPLALYAVALGSPRLLSDLIAARADLFVLIPSARRKLSLLHVAAMLGFTGIFKQIVEAGGDRMRRGAASADCLYSNSASVSSAGTSSSSGTGAGAGAGAGAPDAPAPAAAGPVDTVRPSDPLVYFACAAGQPELLRYLVEDLGADPAVAAPDCKGAWPSTEQYGLDAPLEICGAPHPSGGPPPSRIGQHFADALHAACVGRRGLALEAGLLCDALMPPIMEASLAQNGIHVSFAGDWPRGTHPVNAVEAAESGVRAAPADARGVLALLLDRYGIGGLAAARYGDGASSSSSGGGSGSSALVRASGGSGASRDLRSPLPPAAWHAYAALAAQHGNADAVAVLLERGLLDTPLPAPVSGGAGAGAASGSSSGGSVPALAVLAPASADPSDALVSSSGAAALEISSADVAAVKSSLLFAATGDVLRGRAIVQQQLQLLLAKLAFRGPLALKLLLSAPPAAMMTKLAVCLPHDMARCAALITERAAWLHASSTGAAPSPAAGALQLSPLYPRLWTAAARDNIIPASLALQEKRIEVQRAMAADAARRGPPRGQDGKPIRGPDGAPLEAEDSFAVLTKAIIASAERAANRFARALQAAHDAADADMSTAGAAGKGVAALAAREGAAALAALLDVGDNAVEATADGLGGAASTASTADGASASSSSSSTAVPASTSPDAAFLRHLAPGYEMKQERFAALCTAICAPQVPPPARRTGLWRAHVESMAPTEVLDVGEGSGAEAGVMAGVGAGAGAGSSVADGNGDVGAADVQALLDDADGAVGSAFPSYVRFMLHAIRPEALSLSLADGAADASAAAASGSSAEGATSLSAGLRSASSKGRGTAAVREVLASFGLGTEAVDAAETARSNALLSRRAMLRELQVTAGALAWYRSRPHVLGHAAALWTASEDIAAPVIWTQAPARLTSMCNAAAARGAAAAAVATSSSVAGALAALSAPSLRSFSRLSRKGVAGSGAASAGAGEDEDSAVEALAAAAIADSSDTATASPAESKAVASGSSSSKASPGGWDPLFLAVLVAMLAAAAYIIASWATGRI